MNASAQEKWERCLRQIAQEIPERAFTSWFSPLRFIDFADGQLTVSAPNRFVCEFIEGHYLDLLQRVLNAVFGKNVRLQYSLKKLTDSDETDNETTRTKVDKKSGLDPRLNTAYTFDTFVEGESNRLARSVALSIAEKPGQETFNPFFLYGPSGVGKTHLVNAVGVRLHETSPEKRVLFVSAHLFKTQYTDSVIHNKFNDFVNFYQTIDVLIIDDIQELTTAKTQHAFFHIFNHLQQNHRQLIITCDRPPVLFEGIEERMLTRFKWGMVAEIERPDIELRRAILFSKIKRDGLSIPSEVVQYIAQNVSDNVRDLEGIVNSLMAYSVVYNCDIDLQFTEHVITRYVNLEKKELTLDDILRKVCGHYGVKVRDVQSKSRKQGIVQARQLAMFLSRKFTDMPLAAIGRRIGGRDHSTVLHSCSQVERRIAVDKPFRREVEELECELKK